MSAQAKPFWMSWRRFGAKTYGTRDNLSITVHQNRPWYRGYFYVNGWNTEFQGDADGRYYYRSVKAPRCRIKAKARVCS